MKNISPYLIFTSEIFFNPTSGEVKRGNADDFIFRPDWLIGKHPFVMPVKLASGSHSVDGNKIFLFGGMNFGKDVYRVVIARQDSLSTSS